MAETPAEVRFHGDASDVGTAGLHPAVEGPHSPGGAGAVSIGDVSNDAPEAMYEESPGIQPLKDLKMSLPVPGSVQESHPIDDSTRTISLAELPRSVPGTVPEEFVMSQTDGLLVLGPEECQESFQSVQPANIRAWEISQNEVPHQIPVSEHEDSAEAQADVQVVLILNDSGNAVDEVAVSLEEFDREAPPEDMVTDQDPADAECSDPTPRADEVDVHLMNQREDAEEERLEDNCADEVDVQLMKQREDAEEERLEDNCGGDGSAGGSHSNGDDGMTNKDAVAESMEEPTRRSERIRTRNTPSVQIMFQCEYCDLMFGQVESLRQHKETCTSRDPYRCEYCPKTFPTFKGLKEHQNLYTVDKPYQLGYCKVGFMDWAKSSEEGEILMDLDVAKESKTESKGRKNKQSPRRTPGATSSEKSSVKEYKCDLCEKTFPSNCIRNRHEITSHPERRPYKCDVCQKSFASTTYLKDHMVVHTGAKPFQCAHCEAVFSHRTTRRNHERKFHSAVEPKTSTASVGLKEHRNLLTTDEPQHSYCKSSNVQETATNSNGSVESGNDVEMLETGGEKGKQSSLGSLGTNRSEVVKYKCNSCERTFPKRHLRAQHETTVHPEWRPNTCDVCKKTLASPSHLREHMVVHTGARPFPCRFCEKAFGRKHGKNTHERDVHGAVIKRFQCDHCDRTFPNGSRLEAHRSSHLSEPSRGTQRATGKKEDSWEIYGCSLCEKTFSHDDLRNKHEIRAHPEWRPHKCDVCGETFESENTLDEHMVVHPGATPFPCRHCPQVFGLRSSRREHEMVHTSGEAHRKRHHATHFVAKRHHCDKCGKNFKSKSGLLYHLRNHRGERPCQCEICGKTFTASSTLIKHVEIHQKTTRYKCFMCGEGFDQITDLTKHKQIHTVVKPYQCDICGNTFRTTSHLHGHRRGHTNEKRHECNVCQKKYSRSSSLKKHKLTHREEMAPPVGKTLVIANGW